MALLNRNPFNPGAGTTPPYLAGRETHIKRFETILKSVKGGHPENILMYGLRGTGKTVLLDEFQKVGLRENFIVIKRLQYSQKYCDPSEFDAALRYDIRTAVETFSKMQMAKGKLQAVISYLKPRSLGIPDVLYYEPSYDKGKTPFEDHLRDYLTKNWEIFDEGGYGGVVFLFDEFHEVQDRPERSYVLTDFIGAVDDAQKQGCRYLCVLTGLPSLVPNVKAAKSYSERMFRTHIEIENLNEIDAAKAIEVPLKKSGYDFSNDLVKEVVNETGGYPYFLQLYGKEIIDNVGKREVKVDDFRRFRPLIIKQLDDGFFAPRFEVASAIEQRTLCSMTKLKKRDMSFAEIRRSSGVERRDLSTYLGRMSSKGLVYQYKKGMYRFSMPLLHDYLIRRCARTS
jgi:hypothetical protein